jgi:hypothetical protein
VASLAMLDAERSHPEANITMELTRLRGHLVAAA